MLLVSLGGFEFFVEENVGILVLLEFEFGLTGLVLSSVPLLLDFLGVDLFDFLVVEQIPLAGCSGEGVVVAGLGSSCVDDGAPEGVGIVLVLEFGVACQVFGSILFEVEFEGEVEVAVDLNFLHFVVVELESFEHNYQDVRELFDAESL